MTEDLQPVILPGTAPPPSLAGAPDGGDADVCPRGGWAAPEDLELAGCLKRIGGGDEGALAELYDSTGGRVYSANNAVEMAKALQDASQEVSGSANCD